MQTRAYLGLALLGAGRPSDAEPHLLAGYDGLSKAKTLTARQRTRLRMVTQGLVELYAVAHQGEKVAEWRAKLAALPPEAAPAPRPAG